MITRPYFLGLNNPRSSEPWQALFPHDATATGSRIIEMIRLARPLTEKEWLVGVQRVNLLSDCVLPRDYRSAARRRGKFLAPFIKDRVVVLLGADVATAMEHDASPFEWRGSWITIPHPSGKNRFYNDYVNRVATGILLSDILSACWEKRDVLVE